MTKVTTAGTQCENVRCNFLNKFESIALTSDNVLHASVVCWDSLGVNLQKS